MSVLSSSKDNQIEKTRQDLAEANSVRIQLKARRDSCFKALVDLQTERRVMLGQVSKKDLL